MALTPPHFPRFAEWQEPGAPVADRGITTEVVPSIRVTWAESGLEPLFVVLVRPDPAHHGLRIEWREWIGLLEVQGSTTRLTPHPEHLRQAVLSLRTMMVLTNKGPVFADRLERHMRALNALPIVGGAL